MRARIGFGLALAAAVGALAGAAAAATPPVGAWNCYAGPSWSSFGQGAAAQPAPTGEPVSQLWILGPHSYATDTRTDVGTYDLEGNAFVGRSGPFQRVPVSAHFVAQGLGRKPTIFVSWATAPTLAVVCQPSP